MTSVYYNLGMCGWVFEPFSDNHNATGARVKSKHDMYLIPGTWKCGSLSFIFTHPPEDKKKQKTKKNTVVIIYTDPKRARGDALVSHAWNLKVKVRVASPLTSREWPHLSPLVWLLETCR